MVDFTNLEILYHRMSVTKVPSGHLALFEFSGGKVKNMMCRTVWPFSWSPLPLPPCYFNGLLSDLKSQSYFRFG